MKPVSEVKPVSIVLSPTVIKYKETANLQIWGSGFTPDSVVTVEIVGLSLYKGISAAALGLGISTVNKYQSFAISVDLNQTLWGVTTVWNKPEDLYGVYTVVAKTELGEIASTPLVIEPAAAKK